VDVPDFDENPENRKIKNTARIFGLFDERKIEAFGGVWLATSRLLYITPQK
jgi:hypothetical protein